MPPLSARTGLPCLFCAVPARPRAQRLVPRLYAVHTFSTSNASRRENYRKGGALRISTNQSMYRLDLTGRHPPKATLHSTVREKLNKIKAEFIDPEYLQTLHLTREEFDREWLTFERSISAWVKEANPEAITLANEAKRGKSTLEKRLRHLFFSQSIGGRFTAAELENQRKVADLQYPSEWYPATREIKRTIHLHVGPTNSGKTYHALKRLEEAESGIYLGPLRLLAYEVYSRLNAKGRPCALLTGDEQRIPQDQIPTMFSCTVEMAPLNRYSEVAVIDEIQMINHSERGWAWTQAFLGLKAKEIHLCGEARTVPLIRHLCGLLGDDVHVHEYERLTPLKIAPKSLRGSLQSLEKGDCIVAFSVLGIHALRREIEKKTGKRCAIVYGSLPPETRAQQARLFNDPDNDYDFLVASDAIGMGLNLAIKRVIFESTMKNNGVNYVPLQISEIKQIAGRAGRYRTAHQAITEDRADASVANDSAESIVDLGVGETASPQLAKKPENQVVGYATTLENIDYQYLKSAMEQEPEPILQAGLAPPSIVVERFASYFPPGTPFSYILLRLNEVTKIDSRFFLCSLRDQLAIADAIHKVRNLSIVDRNIICACPANMRDSLEKAFVQNLAACIADGKSGHLLDLKNLPLEVLDEKPVEGRGYLSKLEQLHKLLVCYLWLSYRYPNVFITRTLASRVKEMTEYAIESALVNFSTTEKFRRRLAERREKAFRKAHGRGKNDTTPPEGQQIPQSTDMPKEAVEILTDVRSFASGPPPSDDMGEYPEEPKMENSTMKIRG